MAIGTDLIIVPIVNDQAVYSPIKTIDLRHASTAEASQEDNVKFTIFFNDRDYTFKMDSELARKDWVKVIKKSIFHGKMEGDKVKVCPRR